MGLWAVLSTAFYHPGKKPICAESFSDRELSLKQRKKKKRVLGWSRAERRIEKAFLTECSLLEDLERMFVDNRKRRRVYIHPVPAPWSRVILVSLIYAMAISIAKFAWFQAFGKPNWFVRSSEVVQEVEPISIADPALMLSKQEPTSAAKEE